MIKLLFNTLSIYLCIRILKNQNYGNEGKYFEKEMFFFESLRLPLAKGSSTS